MSRSEPKKETIRKLFALSGNICAFPKCPNKLVNTKGKYVGNVCHIEAAEDGGERYNELQTDEERRSFENLILLCPNHHIETNDVDEYSVEILKKMKRKHETKFLENQYQVSEGIIDKAIENLLQEIKLIGERTEKNTEKILENQSDVKNLLQGLISTNNLQNDYLTREFENLKELKESKNYSAVIKLLEKYKSRDWSTFSDEQKYKIDLNLALTYLDLIEEKKAAVYLIELPKYGVKLEDSFSYAALGYSLLGNKKDAINFINKALALNPENETAILSLLLVKSSEQTIEELEKLIPEKLTNSPTITLNLALKAQNQKKYETALKWIEKTVLNSKEDSSFLYDAKAHKATIILKSRQDNFKDAHNQFSEEDIKEFKVAENLLQESWDYFKDTELKKSRGYYLTNLSAVKKFLGKIDEAIIDAESSIGLFQNYMSYRNLILLLFEDKRYDRALLIIDKAFEIAKNENENGDLVLFKVSIYEQKKMPNEAITVLLSAISEIDLDKLAKGEIFNKLISNYLLIDNVREAIRYLEMLKTEFPNHISTLLRQAQIDNKIGNIEEFAKSLDVIYERLLDDSSELNKIYFHYLAEDYVSIKEFNKARICFEQIVDKKVYNNLTKSYLISLFNIGDYGKVMEIAIPLKRNYPNEYFLSEILYQVYYNNTNYEDALRVCNDIINVNPNPNPFILKRCFLYIKTGKEENINKDLEQINSITSFSLTEIFNYAYLFIHIGKPLKALEIAYNARIENYQNPDVHNKYFGIITEIKDFDTGFWVRDVVEIDTSVFIESLHDKRILTYTIVDYEPKAPDEIFKDNDFAKKLLHRKIDDIIELDSSNSYRIVKIFSKYKFALEDTIEVLTTKFSKESSVRRLQFLNPQDVFEKMSDEFDQNNNFFGQLDDLYSKGQMTIGAQSVLLKRNCIDIWFNILSKPTGLKCINSRVELVEDIKNIYSSGTITISIESLLAINALKIFDLIFDNFKVHISQSCIDEIELFLEEMKKIPDIGMLSLVKVGNEYFRNEFSKENANKNIEIFEGLINGLKEKAKILPSQTSFKINFQEKQKYDNVLGKCFVDSILIAKETNSVLLSDDYANRCIAKNDFNVNSTEIFAIFHYLLKNTFISEPDFIRLTGDLISINYRTIPLSSSKILMQLLDKSEYQLKFPFLNACEGLEGNFINNSVSCNILAEFLQNLYLEDRLKILREHVAIHAIKSYFKARNPKSAKMILMENLKNKFKFLPTQFYELLQILKYF